jgi:hypothetical protein
VTTPEKAALAEGESKKHRNAANLFILPLTWAGPDGRADSPSVPKSFIRPTTFQRKPPWLIRMMGMGNSVHQCQTISIPFRDLVILLLLLHRCRHCQCQTIAIPPHRRPHKLPVITIMMATGGWEFLSPYAQPLALSVLQQRDGKTSSVLPHPATS